MMRRRPDSTLIPRAHLRLKPMTVRIPEDTMEHLHRVKDDANALGYLFDVQNIVIDALQSALERADKELEQMLEQSQ